MTRRRRTQLGVLHTSKYGRYLSFTNVGNKAATSQPQMLAEHMANVCIPLGVKSVIELWFMAWAQLEELAQDALREVERVRKSGAPAHLLDEDTPLERAEGWFNYLVSVREDLIRVRAELAEALAAGNDDLPVCFRPAKYEQDDIFIHESTHALLHYALPMRPPLFKEDPVRDGVIYNALTKFMASVGPACAQLWENYGNRVRLGTGTVEETLTSLFGAAKLAHLDEAGFNVQAQLNVITFAYESYAANAEYPDRSEMRDTLWAAGREVAAKYPSHYEAFDAFYPYLRKEMEKASR